MEWFEKWFESKLYLKLYSKRDDAEARLLVNLIQRKLPQIPSESKVLDICCGTGRHSIEFARRGFDVTAFDLSAFFISLAKKSYETENEIIPPVRFMKLDMRKFNFKEKFDLAVNIFSSFGYFEKDEDNFIVFKNAYSSLKKNGFFVFDFLNSDYIKQHYVKMSTDKVEIGKGKFLRIVQKRRIENGFIIKDIYTDTRFNNPDYTERVRLYDAKKLRKELKNAGFRLLKTYGDYFGNDFDFQKSKRIIFFAKKN